MKRGILILLVAMLLASAVLPAGLAEVIVIMPDQGSKEGTQMGEGEVLQPGTPIKVDGDYSIEFDGALILADELLYQNGYFSYVDSRENGAPLLRYDYPVGTHTTGVVGFVLTNRTKKNVNFFDRVKCTLIYDDIYTFDTFAYQHNPDQVVEGGRTDIGSIDAVDIEPLISVNYGFAFAVPYVVRDSSAPLIARICVDDDVYTVDLRQNMQVIKSW